MSGVAAEEHYGLFRHDEVIAYHVVLLVPVHEQIDHLCFVAKHGCHDRCARRQSGRVATEA